MSRISADKKLTVIYSVWIVDAETKTSRKIFESDSYLRLIGWSLADQELILVTSKKSGPLPIDAQLVSVSVLTDEPRQIATLQSAYLYNIHLSADKRMLAFSSCRDDIDDIFVIPSTGGEARKLTSNKDPRLYFSSLAWSPDGRTIYFGKQSRYNQLLMITNFK